MPSQGKQVALRSRGRLTGSADPVAARGGILLTGREWQRFSGLTNPFSASSVAGSLACRPLFPFDPLASRGGSTFLPTKDLPRP